MTALVNPFTSQQYGEFGTWGPRAGTTTSLASAHFYIATPGFFWQFHVRDTDAGSITPELHMVVGQQPGVSRSFVKVADIGSALSADGDTAGYMQLNSNFRHTLLEPIECRLWVPQSSAAAMNIDYWIQW